MEWLIQSLMLAAALTGGQPQPAPMTLAQPIPTFDSQAKSRLAALAHLGSIAHLSILVESGEMEFLQQPVTVDRDGETLDSVIAQIVRGPEQYQVRQQGSLLIVYPSRPAQPINRILKLPLGPVKYGGSNILDLDMFLSYAIEKASGCKDAGGFAWAGIAFALGVRPFSLPSGTFEQILEKIAMDPQPSIWVVAPDDGNRGCIDNPIRLWEAGMYNNTPSVNDLPLGATTGPAFVR